jgi:hypothetical protein
VEEVIQVLLDETANQIRQKCLNGKVEDEGILDIMNDSPEKTQQ